MASIRIHEDQENRATEMRAGKSVIGGQQHKRAVLGVLNTNRDRVSENLKAGKQVLANHNDDKENRKRNLVNPVVPVAQFEAFKVYEDNLEQRFARADQILKARATCAVYDGTEQRFYTKRELKELEQQRREQQVRAERERVTSGDDEATAKRMNEQLQRAKPPLNGAPMSISPIKQLPNEKENKAAPAPLIIGDGQVAKDGGDATPAKTNKDLFFEMEEYRNDIYTYLREHELRHRPKPGYMKKQPDVTATMRSVLVDWLVEVAEEYRLHTETLYLTVNFIDRFLSYMSVVRAKLQLVGTAAMFLASKYEEIYPPEIGEFVYITDDTYTKRQVIRMEHLILKVLGFDLSVPTALSFITAISVSNKQPEKITCLAMYLSELALLDGDAYLEYLPSTIAASAIALARHTCHLPAWPADLEQSTGYDLKQLRNCINFLQEMFMKAPTHPQQAIQNKYKSQKYFHVSRTEARADSPINFD